MLFMWMFAAAVVVVVVANAMNGQRVNASDRGDGRGSLRRISALEIAADRGPRGTSRAGLRYYDVALGAAVAFAKCGTSALEVGCVNPAFIEHLKWIPHRTCVSPYFAGYKALNSTPSASSDDAEVDADDGTSYVRADFMNYDVGQRYDVVVCMQVVEHVRDPRAFVRKLLKAGDVVIISVPYKWRDCGAKCSHVSHDISLRTMANWSGGLEPTQTSIVRERGDGAARLVVVYETTARA